LIVRKRVGRSVKGKDAVVLRMELIGGVLISLSQAIEPAYVDISLGRIDALPVRRQTNGRYQLFTAW